jgi:hypothetical protein
MIVYTDAFRSFPWNIQLLFPSKLLPTLSTSLAPFVTEHCS